MKVALSTTLDAPAVRVWQEVRTTRLLAYVAAPLQVFEPLEPPELPEVWSDGAYRVRLKLLGVLPVGTQCIVISFPAGDLPGHGRFELRDNGYGSLAKRWDHRIVVQALPDGRTRYTDSVEVRAGLLTPLVWAFATAFYRHRQRRWRRLVRRGFRYR